MATFGVYRYGMVRLTSIDEVMDNPASMTPVPFASKLETLLNHLVKCNHIPVESKTHALLLKRYRQSAKSGKENCHIVAAASSVLSLHTPPPSRTLVLRHTPNSESSASTPSRVMTRSFSETDMAMFDDDSPAAQRARYEEATAHVDAREADPRTFPFSLSQEFQGDFTKLLITGNVAFRAAENPYWKHFFNKWIPGAVLPPRQAVGGRLLDDEAQKVIKVMKAHVVGRYGTGQLDGWKNIAKASIIGSMVNAEYEVCVHIIAVLSSSYKPVPHGIALHPPYIRHYPRS